MVYEVWSTVAGSILGGYETEEAALAAVRAVVARYGEAYGEGLALAYEDRSGRSRAIAQGAALVRRALTNPGTPAAPARRRGDAPSGEQVAAAAGRPNAIARARPDAGHRAPKIAATKSAPRSR
jgi:hypothetical protein